ncbi:hypothetical protein ACIBIZ_22735 [Nonomuraea spiralis]|uniref:hypothetical protein n=1 Tax=Nonomuraea TaxID=83681 RepID=UPI000F7916FA|nr:hypothetical protein [Nonomuraea sp. WAC 01424]RSN06712.1 hypothetical protein DMB42_25995 [Nonomuraea sp. WAC 01424]
MSAASVWLRLSRAVVFATVCGAVSAGGHLLAGGGAVPLWGGALGVLTALAAALLVSGRERGPAAVLAATTLTQLVLHQLFERLAPATGVAPGHGHPAPAMTLVHLTVAALTAWWLHRGERALWLMIRLYAAPPPVTALLLLAPVEVTIPPRRPPAHADVPAPMGRTACRTLTRRGPPQRLRLR